MKTKLFTIIITTLLTGQALAAPAPGKPTAQPAPAPAAGAPAALNLNDLFGSAVRDGFRLGAAMGGGFQVARCECEDTREVCEKQCELWNQNGTCAKWGLPVCIEKCVKWSCEEKH